MGVHLYTNGAWTDSGKIYRNSMNLFDYTDTTDIINQSYINQNGSISESIDYYISYPIEVEAGEKYTWRFNSENVSALHSAPTVGFYDSDNTLIGVASHSPNVRFFSFTVPISCKYIRCSVYQRSGVQAEAMLNVGLSPLPYEQYNVIDWYTNTGHGYTSGAWT